MHLLKENFVQNIKCLTHSILSVATCTDKLSSESISLTKDIPHTFLVEMREY